MKDTRFHVRADCRACGSRRLETVVALNPLPLVSPNVGVEQGGDVATKSVAVPADLFLCRDCGLLQLTAVIDPAFQYNRFKYVTTISLGLSEHFRTSAGEIMAAARLDKAGCVLEIGSNDGTLLSAFQERGWEVLGIDPALKAVERAVARGIPTIRGFFDPAGARDINAAHDAFDLVIANNTLANIDDLAGVAAGLDSVLAPDGVFAFETSYGADVVTKNLLDTIYHEHLSYFMVKPLAAFFARHGFELFNVSRIATKGGSIRGFVQRRGGSRPMMKRVANMIAEEGRDDLYTPVTYRGMAAKIVATKRKLAEIIAPIRDRGGKVAAYGASVGCATLINQLDLAKYLVCVFDDQPLLDAIAGPDYNITVVASDEIYRRRPDLIVLLAWRYADLILERHQAFRDAGGRFVLPLPEVAVL